MPTRKKYSKEFKLDAISLVLDQGYTVTQAGSSLGINAYMLRRWIQEQTVFFANAGPRQRRLLQRGTCKNILAH